jgi:branched-chain amino acid transport system permease protein
VKRRIRQALALVVACLAVIASWGSAAHADDYSIRVRVQAQSVENGVSVKKPVAGVDVKVTDESGKEIGKGTTGDDGVATIGVPGPATYKVELDESTLPEGETLDANTPAAATVDSGRFVTSTVTVNFFTGIGAKSGAGYWSQFAQRLVDGARLGLVLAMCSVGLSLIFGTTGLTNFAHGELVTLGAMVAFLCSVPWGLNFYLSTLIAILVGGLVGLALNEGVFKPLRERHIGLISQLVVTVGLSILLKNFFLYRFGGRTKLFGAFNNQIGKKLGPITITIRDLTTSIVSMVILVLVALTLQRTRLGKATRAVSDNPDLASSTGIDTQMIIRIVWFAGAALAALGGVFRGLDEGISPSMGSDLLFLLFAGITLGGLGSAYGALVGGFITGLFVEITTLGMPVFPKHWPRPLNWLHDGVPTELKSVPALLILIIILLVRPQGILGRRERVG